MEFNQAVVTAKGQALMAKLLAGSATTKFTKIATSSTVYQQSQLAELTALSNVKQTIVPNSYEINASTVKVVGAINNEELVDGYYINTIGLYATDSDGSEILYSVAIASVNGYMPPNSDISKSGVELKIYTAVSNASKVDLTVDPSVAATIGDIAEINESLSHIGDKLESLSIKTTEMTEEQVIEIYANAIGIDYPGTGEDISDDDLTELLNSIFG